MSKEEKFKKHKKVVNKMTLKKLIHSNYYNTILEKECIIANANAGLRIYRYKDRLLKVNENYIIHLKRLASVYKKENKKALKKILKNNKLPFWVEEFFNKSFTKAPNLMLKHSLLKKRMHKYKRIKDKFHTYYRDGRALIQNANGPTLSSSFLLAHHYIKFDIFRLVKYGLHLGHSLPNTVFLST
jgi:hypothetical protein